MKNWKKNWRASQGSFKLPTQGADVLRLEAAKESNWPGAFIRSLENGEPKFHAFMLAFTLIAKESRLGAGFSQKLLAQKIGTTEKVIADFEAGEVRLDGHLFERLKKVLLIDILIDPTDEQLRRHPGMGISLRFDGTHHPHCACPDRAGH